MENVQILESRTVDVRGLVRSGICLNSTVIGTVSSFPGKDFNLTSIFFPL